MPNGTYQSRTIAMVAERIRSGQDRYRGNESATRADLVAPILDAYGWKLNDQSQVRSERGNKAEGRPDYSLLNPDNGTVLVPVEVKSLGNPDLEKHALAQAQRYTDGNGRNAKLVVITDGAKWKFFRPGERDANKPLAACDLATDKPEDAATTLTRVIRPSSLAAGKTDKELDKAEERPDDAPDRRLNDYVALDLETTGFSANKDRIIELGAVRFRNGQEVERIQTFVNPQRPIPAPVQELTGISDRDTRNAPTWDQVQDKVKDFIGDDPIVAHNAGFDKRFLDANGLQTSQDWYDTLRLSRRLNPEKKTHNLEALTQRLGMKHEGAHRADADAKVTSEVFNRLLDKTESMSDAKLESLARETSRRGQRPETALILGAQGGRRPKPALGTRPPAKSSSRRPIIIK